MPDEKPKADSVQPSAGTVEAPSTPAPGTPPRRRVAWQPFTPGGIAAFGDSHAGRVWGMQVVMALLVGAMVSWFVATAWFPTVRAAIRQLPDQGMIQLGELASPYQSSEPLASSPFVSITIELESETTGTGAADVRIQFQKRQLRVCSLFGCLSFRYPPGYTFGLNRGDAEPWWGAWQPILLALAGVGTAVGLILVWNGLALVYAPLVWFFAYLKDRDLGLAGSWRVASAALIPSALILTAGIVAYALEGLDLVRWLGLFAIHFPLAWVFAVGGVLARPRSADAIRVPISKNPFTSAGDDPPVDVSAGPKPPP